MTTQFYLGFYLLKPFMKAYVYESIDKNFSSVRLVAQYIEMAKCISSVIQSESVAYYSDFGRCGAIIGEDKTGQASLRNWTTLNRLEQKLYTFNITGVGGMFLFKMQENNICIKGYLKHSNNTAGIKLVGLSKGRFEDLKDELSDYCVKRVFL